MNQFWTPEVNVCEREKERENHIYQFFLQVVINKCNKEN